MTTETPETETSEAMEASEATGMSELRAVVQRVEALERRLGLEQALPKNRAAEVEKLVLRDQSGKVRAWLGLLADGSPGLMLTDREGKGGIALSAAADGSTAPPWSPRCELNRLITRELLVRYAHAAGGVWRLSAQPHAAPQLEENCR